MCHGRGAARLFGADGTVVDVGGQDTKVIRLRGGRVARFAVNDKCAARTGRFLEVMADRLGVSHDALSALARAGVATKISSACTVFAESGVIGLVGRGEPRESIARGSSTRWCHGWPRVSRPRAARRSWRPSLGRCRMPWMLVAIG